MAGNNNNDVLVADFCKSARLGRISKQYALPDPLSGIEPTMLSSLGCFPVVSLRDVGAIGVLERVAHASGNLDVELLASADGTSRAYPGPSSHVYTIPDTVGAAV